MAGRDCTKFMEHIRIVRIIYGNGNALENSLKKIILTRASEQGWQ